MKWYNHFKRSMQVINMKFIAALVAAVALPLLLLSPFARADSITVGDYTQPGDFTVLREGKETLAPVLAGLAKLNYSFITKGTKLSIRTPAGRGIFLTMDNRLADVDDEKVELAAAPRFINQRCYLPLNSLAEALGMLVKWDKDEKALTLSPKLSTLKVEEAKDNVIFNIGAQVRLNYEFGKLVDPPRLLFDLSNIALEGGTQKIEVNSGDLLSVRTAPRDTGLRIVVDLAQPILPKIEMRPDGCLLKVIIPKKSDTLPLPKAILTQITFTRPSARIAALSLSLSAPAVVDSEMNKREKLLIVKVTAANKIEELPKIPDNDLVAGLQLRSHSSSEEVQELRIKLKKETQHQLIQEGKTVRILIGEFSLSGIKIAVDPGHGGCMSGAPGRSGLMEKDVNLDIALRLERLLKEAGAKVFLTRSEDCELRPMQDASGKVDLSLKRAELRMRPALANAVGTALFISIHNNANAPTNSHPHSGSEVYYWTPQSRLLAAALHDEVVKSLGRRAGGVFNNHDFWVIKDALMPAALVEVAYMDNKEEEKLLATEEFRELAAKGIFAGITRYVASGGPLGAPGNSAKKSETADSDSQPEAEPKE